MADLTMPEGLSEDEQREWMLRLAQQLVAETGQPSGVTPNQQTPDGQPVWGMWWTEEPPPPPPAT